MVLLLAGALQVVTVVVPSAGPRAEAAVTTGTGGEFVPAVGRLMNSTSMTANVWRSLQVTGQAGLPTSGVAAVQVTLSALTPTASGVVRVAPSGQTSVTTALHYGGGLSGSVSNTAIVAVGNDGKINLEATTALDLIVDVQGYFTAGNTAAGGFVVTPATRIVDTQSGLGAPKAKLVAGSILTIQAAGLAGVPATASAVFVNVTVINDGAPNNGYVTPYAADAVRPSTGLDYPANATTALGTTVPLSTTAGSAGQFKLFNMGYSGAAVEVLVDIEGYYTAATDSGAFTPAATRVAAINVPGNTTVTKTIAGVAGVPAAGTGIVALAANIQVTHTASTAGGYLRVWPSDQSYKVSVVNYAPAATVSNFTTFAIGADGAVVIENHSPDLVQVYVDVQGWYTSLADNVVKDAQNITQKSVVLQAKPNGTTPVIYQYRVGLTNTFAPIPVGGSGYLTDANGSKLSAWPLAVTGSGGSASFTPYVWDIASMLGSGVTNALIQVRACFGTSPTDPNLLCSMPSNITFAPGSFGDNNATTDLGVGSLSLLTGDLQVSSTDAVATSSLGGLSIGRSLTTLAPANVTGAAGVFGPGWTADLTGPDAGEGGLTVTDAHTSGYLSFADGDGWTAIYQATSSVTGTNPFPISFTGTGDNAGDGSTVTMVDASTITMADADGTITTYTRPAGSTTWQTSKIAQPGSNTTSGYTYDNAGRVTRILAPSPAGLAVACNDTNADTTPGCRSLKLTYGTPAGTPAGTIRLTDVTLSAPQTAGTTTYKSVAQYSYDASGRLIAAWDPRLPGLKTSYGYVASGTNAGRLETITPPGGERAWTLIYDAQHRVIQVQRNVPVGNPISGATDKTATTTIVYGVPNSGAGLPSMNPADVDDWGQTTSLPVSTDGAAVFGPDHVPAGTTPSAIAAADSSGAEWRYATLHYLDVNGRETNTASYGQESASDGTGHWLIDTTQYDTNGNPVWHLSAGNRSQALNPTSDTDSTVAGTASTADRADLLAATTSYNPLDPTEVTDTFGPTHPVTLDSGTVVHGRVHVHTDYDEGAPGVVDPATGQHTTINAATGANYRLPTTVTTTVFDTNQSVQTDIATSADISVQHLGYAAVSGMVKSGWDLGVATTSTVQMGAGPSGSDLVTTTVYDADGRPIETRLPGNATGDAAGTSPRTTKTSYYTATGTGDCVSATSAGLVCKTAPGGQPSDTPLPTTVTVYDAYGNPTSSTETFTATGAGGGTAPSRTTTTTYDAAERVTQTSVTTANVTGSQPVPAVSYTYDPATGRQITQSTGSGSSLKTITTGYDSAGRVFSYTDATGAVTYTGYDIDGRPVSRVDAKGASTWTYDSSSEHRGLVTLERHASAPVSTDPLGSSGATDADGNLDLTSAAGEFGFTAAYNAEGSQADQGYPNGLDAVTSYDNAGNPTSLAYAKAGTTWMSFTQTNGAGERTVARSSTVGGQVASSQAFGYDNAGRLTLVQDTVGPAISGSGTSCETRQYGFDQHSNRLSLTTNPAGTGGVCSTTTTATTVNYAYDAADRITGGYVYDAMGRTLTVPGSDAAGTGSHTAATGQLNLGYYDNDLVASQTQGSGASAQSVAFGLDVQQNRFAGQTTTAGAVTTAVANHYDDGSDSPAWTATTVTGGTSPGDSWRANVTGPDGNLAAVVDQTGVATLQLCNLHGDIVATTPASGTATGVTDYTEATEYGIPRTAATAKAPYGWVGGKQRSTDDLGGLTLMGVRLYNPATGRFLSVDPIYGGNANTYNYPDDPINGYDLNGKCSPWNCLKSIAHHAVHSITEKGVNSALSILEGVLGAACKASGFAGLVCAAAVGAFIAGLGYIANHIVFGSSFSQSGLYESAGIGALNAVGGKASKVVGSSLKAAATELGKSLPGMIRSLPGTWADGIIRYINMLITGVQKAAAYIKKYS